MYTIWYVYRDNMSKYYGIDTMDLNVARIIWDRLKEEPAIHLSSNRP
jgi:hypothetical protein